LTVPSSAIAGSVASARGEATTSANDTVPGDDRIDAHAMSADANE
jgi:hypothetical protein